MRQGLESVTLAPFISPSRLTLLSRPQSLLSYWHSLMHHVSIVLWEWDTSCHHLSAHPASVSRISQWVQTAFSSCQATAENHCMVKMGHSWARAVTKSLLKRACFPRSVLLLGHVWPRSKMPSCGHGSGTPSQGGAGRPGRVFILFAFFKLYILKFSSMYVL